MDVHVSAWVWKDPLNTFWIILGCSDDFGKCCDYLKSQYSFYANA